MSGRTSVLRAKAMRFRVLGLDWRGDWRWVKVDLRMHLGWVATEVGVSSAVT